MQQNSLLWRVAGFSQQEMDAAARGLEVILPELWDNPPTDHLVITRAWSFIHHGLTLFTMGSLGYELPNPPLNDWRNVGRHVVKAAICYFSGAWRDKFEFLGKRYDCRRARVELDWIDYYRWGLTTSLTLGDWGSANRLLDWPGADLPVDEGVDDRTRSDNAYQIWLALRLRNGSEIEVSKLRAQIAQGTQKRPKMLMAVADSMFAGDAVGFRETLDAYLRVYRGKEQRPHLGVSTLCVDANTLWHLARWRGLNVSDLPDVLSVLIARVS